MKRLGVAALALGALAACETAGETDAVQNLNVNICSPGSPVIKPWDGKFPTLTADSMQVLVPLIASKQQATPAVTYLAADVDAKLRKITWLATVTEAQLPKFASEAVFRGGIIGPGGGGGWPPCRNIAIDGDCLIAVNAIGVHAKLSLYDAEAAAASCP